MPALCSGILAYIKAFRQRAVVDDIRAHVLGKYNAAAMRTAKDVLWNGCRDDLCRLKLEKKVRRTSAARSQELADLDDVLEALDALDGEDCLPEVVCSSEDLLLMPQLLPVVGIEQVAEQLRCFRQEIEDRLDAIDRQVSQASKATTPSTLPASGGSSSTTSIQQPAADQLDRRCNLILFGVPEEKDVSVVSEVLEAVVGSSVRIKDTFRLGKKSKAVPKSTAVSSDHSSPEGASMSGESSTQAAGSRPRPILIKLSCPWDRRIILASKRKLSEIKGMEGYFLQPDLSVEERKKRQVAYLARKNLHA